MIAAGRMFPTEGSVSLLGNELGHVDLRELRSRVGWCSAATELPGDETAFDAVMTGAYDIAGRWQEAYADADRGRADSLLEGWGLGGLAQRTLATLSEGERKRVLIARAQMADPELIVLDEPAAGLDLGGREDLVSRLSQLAADPTAPTQILITHHVEEIPIGTTHALLLRRGGVVASGPISDVMTAEILSTTFGVPLEVGEHSGRWQARRAS
jgi:iron complex transport system ATP-binding protein